VRPTKEKEGFSSIRHCKENLEMIVMIDDFLCDLYCQLFYWKRFGVAVRSWRFRMNTLTDEDLKNKVPENRLGIYSTYCDTPTIWCKFNSVC
jgi:hypothetical protein